MEIVSEDELKEYKLTPEDAGTFFYVKTSESKKDATLVFWDGAKFVELVTKEITL